MARFHMTLEGRAAPCNATVKACPRGGEEAHGEFNSPADAEAWAEKKNSEEFGGSFGQASVSMADSHTDHMMKYRGYDDFTKDEIKGLATIVSQSREDGGDSRKDLYEYFRNEYPGMDHSARLDMVAEAHNMEKKMREATGVTPPRAKPSRASMKTRLGAMIGKLRGFRKADPVSQAKLQTLTSLHSQAKVTPKPISEAERRGLNRLPETGIKGSPGEGLRGEALKNYVIERQNAYDNGELLTQANRSLQNGGMALQESTWVLEAKRMGVPFTTGSTKGRDALAARASAPARARA